MQEVTQALGAPESSSAPIGGDTDGSRKTWQTAVFFVGWERVRNSNWEFGSGWFRLVSAGSQDNYPEFLVILNVGFASTRY